MSISKKTEVRDIDNIIRLPQVHKLLETKSTKEIEVSLPTGDYGLERQVAIQIIPVQGDLKLLSRKRCE